MPDLNLDGLPLLTAIVVGRIAELSAEARVGLLAELRLLVERERAAVAEDCDACQKNHSLWWNFTLPAWAKPVMRELRKAINEDRTRSGFEYMTWYQLVKAYDALTEEQKEEIERG